MVRSETQEYRAVFSNVQTEQGTEKQKLVNRRPRSLTTLKLEVVAERARKMKRIREALASGTYNVQPDLVAKSLLKVFSEDDIK